MQCMFSLSILSLCSMQHTFSLSSSWLYMHSVVYVFTVQTCNKHNCKLYITYAPKHKCWPVFSDKILFKRTVRITTKNIYIIMRACGSLCLYWTWRNGHGKALCIHIYPPQKFSNKHCCFLIYLLRFLTDYFSSKTPVVVCAICVKEDRRNCLGKKLSGIFSEQ